MPKTKSYFPTLALATQGKDKAHTEEAQFLLSNNRWGIKFYQGKIDGTFGPETAQACRAAKAFLGFAPKDVKPVFGPVIRAYLVEHNHPAFVSLPKANRTRMAKAAQKPFRETVLDRSLVEVGYVETPNNLTKFGKAYGENGVAWCAIFCSNMIGFDKFKYSFVPYVVSDAKAKRNGLHVTTDPLPGDLVCFDWNQDGTGDHIGFFGGWIDRAKGVFWTVEGNTSSGVHGDQSNGGGVYKRKEDPRYLTEVEVFVSYSH